MCVVVKKCRSTISTAPTQCISQHPTSLELFNCHSCGRSANSADLGGTIRIELRLFGGRKQRCWSWLYRECLSKFGSKQFCLKYTEQRSSQQSKCRWVIVYCKLMLVIGNAEMSTSQPIGWSKQKVDVCLETKQIILCLLNWNSELIFSPKQLHFFLAEQFCL